MVLNYLAYVSGRLQAEKNISEQEADIRATIELIMGIYAYISEKDLDYDDSDSATVLDLTKDIGDQILAMILFLDPETASQYEVGLMVCVKTEKPIPKDKIFEVMQVIKKARVNAPVKIGDVICKDVWRTDIIAAKTIE